MQLYVVKMMERLCEIICKYNILVDLKIYIYYIKNE